jgi:hypothetical protein
MATYVGHAAVRRWVMGPAASERAATDDEIRAMQALVDDAMREGALGLSTSQLDVHADHEGNPVPPNLAAPEEIVALASVLAAYPQGAMEHLCRSFGGATTTDRRCWRDGDRAGGKSVHVNLLLRFTNDPDMWRTCLDVLEGFAATACALPDGVGQPEGPPLHPRRHHRARRDAEFRAPFARWRRMRPSPTRKWRAPP